MIFGCKNLTANFKILTIFSKPNKFSDDDEQCNGDFSDDEIKIIKTLERQL